MQPYLFPYIGYWQLIAAVDMFVILDDVQVGSCEWLRSNYLRDGKFVLPCERYSQNRQIREINICEGAMTKLIKRVGITYGKQQGVSDAIELIDHRPLTHLSGYVANTLLSIGRHLEMDTGLIASSAIFGKNGNGQDRIIDICKQLGATEYVNSIGGVGLYDPGTFDKEGIRLGFIKSQCKERLSIIDLLCRFDDEQIQDFLTQYEIQWSHQKLS